MNMVQFGVLPTTLDVVLDKLAKRIVEKCKLPETAIIMTLADDSEHLRQPRTDRMVLIRPLSGSSQVGIAAGALRFSAAVDWEASVSLACRFASDTELSSTREFADRTRSILALFRSLYDGLHGFTMENGDTPAKSYLREPLRGGTWRLQTRRESQTTWSVITTNWTLPFVQEMPSGTD